jgi:proton-translocating NADH-quinone oxidoreductase chain M
VCVNLKYVRILSFILTLLVFLYSLVFLFFFESFVHYFQFQFFVTWSEVLNIYYSVGIDGISLFFIILTTFLMPLCFLLSWVNISYRLKEFIICMLLTELFLINVFSVLDLFFFYLFFESILLPMFLIIGIWGSRYRKIHATFQFFFYTLIGSLLMLIAIIYIYLVVGTSDLSIILLFKFNNYTQIFLWLAFFLALAVKIPMMPFHIWLPEAHVEAPTAGSVILAGLLLKMGGYAILRFLVPIFDYANVFFIPFVFLLSSIAILYSSLATIRQLDLKKIIAYSSIAHMNYVTIGLFSYDIQGIQGCIFLMLSHGLVSSALFICVGILYDRYKTRILKYYGGLVQLMPLLCFFFFFF